MDDDATKLWTRNVSDERAAANGCRFDPMRGAETVHWIERYCRLYEGEQAGQPLILHGCHECGDYGLPPLFHADWDDESQTIAMERAARFATCVKAGHPIDWQYECTMRIFGWVRWSKKWQRWVRRFRKAVVFIAKKNKKSPTLAAWGVYLWAGDGEQGQHVFFGAKDGAQARQIVGKHVKEMRLNSPELSAVDERGRPLISKINENSMELLHLPTRSTLMPLSSSNKRTKDAKEGLNGCVCIDEVHVVDRDFVSILKRSHISRSEPLWIEVSTAGNNPDGYGKERFDYAQQVLAGVEDDERLFAALYAAPQTVTDAELEADTLKWARMANPSMGHTVDPEELLEDYATSKRSIQDLLDFKMYRLNIWQNSANPWLSSGDWQRCQKSFTEQDLHGRQCWAALDLSRTRDMSALVLIFEDDQPGEYLLLPYFWLPEERAQALQNKAPFKEWQTAGELVLTSGGVTDFGVIEAKFRELAKSFRILELAYDMRFAEEVTQALEQGRTDGQGNVIQEGTGVTRFAFEQNDESFAAPTHDFERLVIDGKMHHNGHRVLSWQIGHAHVILKQNKVKRVVKPTKDDYRTVDGVQCGIMGLARAQAAEAPAMPGALLL